MKKIIESNEKTPEACKNKFNNDLNNCSRYMKTFGNGCSRCNKRKNERDIEIKKEIKNKNINDGKVIK